MLGELLKEVYKEDVLDECANHILKMLEKQERVKLTEIIKKFERETGGVFSEDWFRKQIMS